MNVPGKLAVFLAAVAVVGAGAYGVGAVTDPIAPENGTVNLTATEASSGDGGHDAMAAPGAPGATAAADEPGTRPVPVGLPGVSGSDRGYTLRLADATPGQGEAVVVAFTIRSPEGGPVLNYRPTHEKALHLIVVRRDLSGFQHLHPDPTADGTWSVPVDLSAAGTYRVFADFAPAALDESLTLGADLFVPGEFAPLELPAPATTWSGDGYLVELTGTPMPGAESGLTFAVTRDGAPVTDLQPYLGAFGHLVALRAGDLAYLHTHPTQEARAGQQGGPTVTLGTTFPTPGTYRLYLNFAHAGSVRTAEFTVEVLDRAAAPAASATPAPPAAGEHSGH